MGSGKFGMFLGLGALALTLVLSQPAAAQAPATPGFAGTAPSSVAGCPNLVWRLARRGDAVNGIAYYSDLSGLSHVTGTVGQAGRFTLTLTSVMGHGPVGTVTGQRRAPGPNQAQGALVADLKGEGCANMHLTMKPIQNLNTYSIAGG